MRLVRDKLGRGLNDIRISVIDSCNFRCTYCMPADIYDHYNFLKKKQLLTFEEITRLVKVFASLGVQKVRLTGGEPLLRKNIEHLIEMIADIPEIEDIALTTNGYLLANKAQSLKDAGLNRVTLSLDTLDPALFKKIAGREVHIETVIKGIQIAQSVGLTPLKVNTVVERGVNEDSILSLARYFKGSGIAIRFIEYMDVGSALGWAWEHVVPASEIVSMINKEFPLEPEQYEGSDVAKRYHYLDGSGQIGVITSVSQPFCGNCVRARLSADGKLYTCLFAGVGTDLRTSLRTGIDDEKLYEMIAQIWINRTDRYSETRHSLAIADIKGLKKVEMFRVGG